MSRSLSYQSHQMLSHNYQRHHQKQINRYLYQAQFRMRVLSQTDKIITRTSASQTLQSYIKMDILQNWCFGQFRRSKRFWLTYTEL